MANEARFHHQSVHNENATLMCGRGMRRAADQRVVVFLSHLPERVQSKEASSLEVRTGNCSKSVTLWTPTQTWFFYQRVSVTHRPAFAKLILGRWKERSLRMKPPSLPILQEIYPDRPKDSEIHFDALAPSAKIKIKKGEKPFSQETLQKKEREINKRGKWTHKSSARMNS